MSSHGPQEEVTEGTTVGDLLAALRASSHSHKDKRASSELAQAAPVLTQEGYCI